MTRILTLALAVVLDLYLRSCLTLHLHFAVSWSNWNALFWVVWMETRLSFKIGLTQKYVSDVKGSPRHKTLLWTHLATWEELSTLPERFRTCSWSCDQTATAQSYSVPCTSTKNKKDSHLTKQTSVRQFHEDSSSSHLYVRCNGRSSSLASGVWMTAWLCK